MSLIFPSPIARSCARTAARTAAAGAVGFFAALVIALTGFRRTTAESSPDRHGDGLTAPAAESMTLAYTAHFAGVGAEGIDNIWVGQLSGPTPGEVTIRVEHLGTEADRAKLVWPVRALTFVATDDASRSFAADLTGTLDWTTGTMRLSGTITEGWRSGAPAEQIVYIDPMEYDGGGTLEVGALTAAR